MTAFAFLFVTFINFNESSYVLTPIVALTVAADVAVFMLLLWIYLREVFANYSDYSK